MSEKTAICYCRVSTARQKDSETIKAQVERCTRLVERHSLRLLPYGPRRDGWLLDEGTTGTLLEGRQFSTFLDDLQARKVKPDCIVVFSLSRISRVDKVSGKPEKIQQSHADNARIVGTLIAHKLPVIDEDGLNDPASIGTQVKMMLANEQFKIIRESTIAGKHRHFREGNFCKGGHPPYGYKQAFNNGVDRKQGYTLEPHPEQAPALKRILAWFCEGGVTHAARRATEEGIPTPMASTTSRKNKAPDWSPTRWSPVTVQHIVRNLRAYLGELHYTFDGQPYTLTYPALIDAQTYARIEKRRKERTLKRRTTFLCTGYADCTCGHHIYVQCSSTYKHVRCLKCRKGMRERDFNRRLFVSLVCRLIEIQMQARQAESPQDFDRRLAAVRSQLEEVNARIQRLVDALLNLGLDRSVFESRNAVLNDEKARLVAEQQRIEGERDNVQKKAESEQSLTQRIGKVLIDLTGDEVTLDKARAAMADVLQGERLVVTWGSGKDGKTIPKVRWPAFGTLPPKAVKLDGPVWPQFFPKGTPGIPMHFQLVGDE